MPGRRLTRIVLIASLAVWIANQLILLLSAYPLGHDEAQYAISAKDMLAGAAPRWFFLSTGMNLITAPGVLAGGGEVALRFVPFLFGVGFILAVWQLARRVFGDETGAWVVAVMAGTRSFMKFSVELLSDMPAATCLVLATIVIVDELSRDGPPRWRVMIAAPLLAAAFYIRYGSIVPIAIIALLALVLGFPAIRRRPWPAIVTAALFVVLLLPHMMLAIRTIGSPFGILLESQSVPQHSSLTEGLVTYLTSNPFVYYGLLSPFVMIAGLLAVRRGITRRAVFLWLAAIADIVAIGLTTHAQVRYIYFGTALLVILGTDEIRRVITAQAPRVRTILTIAVAAPIVFAWVSVTIGRFKADAVRTSGNRATLYAAAAIKADGPSQPCYVLADQYTQLEWYSGCNSDYFDPAYSLAHHQPVYLVRDHRPSWQPNFDEFPGRHHMILDIPGFVHVMKLEPDK